MGTFDGATLINETARRLRDTANTGYSRVLVLNVINRVQDAINVRLGLVHGAAILTTGNTALYSTSAFATNWAYPVQISDVNGRELDQVPFERLVQQDSQWIRRFGDRPELYAPIGRELIAITPIPYATMNLNVRYVKHPTALADAGAPLWDLSDEHKPLLLDLVEAVLLTRSRDFRAMQEAINRAAPKLALEDVAQIIRKGVVGEGFKPPMPGAGGG